MGLTRHQRCSGLNIFGVVVEDAHQDYKFNSAPVAFDVGSHLFFAPSCKNTKLFLEND